MDGARALRRGALALGLTAVLAGPAWGALDPGDLFWGPCREGTEVVLWKLTGAGHVWPGGVRAYLPRLLGPGTTLVDANREMWQFFQRFTR